MAWICDEYGIRLRHIFCECCGEEIDIKEVVG